MGEQAGARRRLRFYVIVLVLVCLFFVVYGAFLAWDSYHRLPHRYSLLRAHGVRTTAKLVECAPGVGGGRGVGCRLSIRLGGLARTWNYPEDSSQFRGLPVGSAIPVLVDPGNSKTIYTVHDVERRTNAGASSPVFWYGIILAAVGLAGFIWLVRLGLPRLVFTRR